MPLYCSLSGGADSTAMAILLHAIEHQPTEQVLKMIGKEGSQKAREGINRIGHMIEMEEARSFELVFSDTGAELPETLWTVSEVGRKLGRRVEVVCNGTFYQHLMQYGYLLPSRHRRWCTRILKQVPLDHYMGRDGTFEVFVGIRADEPKRHKGAREDRVRSHPGVTKIVHHPLAWCDMNKTDVMKLCRDNDLLNPAYTWRSNVSCFCCPFQRIADWRGLFEKHVDYFDLCVQWEEFSVSTGKCQFTWIKGKRLKNVAGCDKAQLRMFPEPDGEACVICQH